MASVCLDCTTRYAAGLGSCPHCGGKKQHDEHEVPEPVVVAEVTPDAKAAEPEAGPEAEPVTGKADQDDDVKGDEAKGM